MVFADDRPAAVAFPRARVASFLRQISPNLVSQYLDYVFEEWHDTAPVLHDDMVAAYLDMITSYEDTQTSMQQRQKLQQFLKTSMHYSPEKALARLPDDGLFEERALVLSRLGRHQQALCLLVFSVANLVLAEQYCIDNAGSCAEVFVLLLRVLFSDPPADVVDNEAMVLDDPNTNADTNVPIETARKGVHRRFAGHLLSTYRQLIPASQALQLLPEDMELTQDMFRYLRSQLCALDQAMRSGNVVRNLRAGEDFQAKRHLHALHSSSVVVSETRTCPHCLKRIGAGTAFAVIPALGRAPAKPAVVHYSCWQRHKATNEADGSRLLTKQATNALPRSSIDLKWA
ncbi:Vacuolar morphogenesis protein 6 [Dipsacomyces acuminosporus]|nr:Vacuolar morphogenesis protein 6 [Dipsacomyces acuminosporus]